MGVTFLAAQGKTNYYTQIIDFEMTRKNIGRIKIETVEDILK